jgi:hypothetical protein
MPAEDLLSGWFVARGAADLVLAYRQLIDALRADAVGICVASIDPLATLRLIASDRVRRLLPVPVRPTDENRDAARRLYT